MSERYLTQDTRVAWRVYDGEAVIVSAQDSSFHTLNAVGTLIWQCADGQTSIDTIVARVCDEFAVEPETAARDAEVFIAELSRRGLATVGERSDFASEGGRHD